MYVRCRLVEIARKSVTETAKCGKEIIRCWPTVLIRIVAGKVAASAMIVHGWLMPAYQLRLDVNNLLHYMC